MPPSAIPDRWIPYKACGKVIEGTRIICFKVPLRKSVQITKSEITEIWDIPTLLQKIPKLGAVIDLTNTARYYDPKELINAGVLHKKILMPGRIIPPEDKVFEFMNAVDEFLGKNKDILVGVHCTHGLNRTGYMVCRYMRDRLGISAKNAIKLFEKARGYQIERENYVADLLAKKPPPPDLSSNTAIKPTYDSRDDISYRTPLSGYEEYTNYSGNRQRNFTRPYRSTRYSNYGGVSRHDSRWNSNNGVSWGSESQRSNSRNRNSRRDYSNRSYDYKYDY